jgi:hypothetical protein
MHSATSGVFPVDHSGGLVSGAALMLGTAVRTTTDDSSSAPSARKPIGLRRDGHLRKDPCQP